MTENIDEIKLLSKKIRANILDMALAAGSSSSHFGGALSSVEIFSTLFKKFLKFDSKKPTWENRDRFILSKGHGCLSYYAALCEMGYFQKSELLTFEKNASFLLGHPVMNRERGIEFSNGSLGMGLSLGVGVALAALRKNKEFKTYVLLGDGECNEGSVWEASMSAAHFNLKNLTAIIDNNSLQQTGTNNEIMKSGSLYEKWKSFEWEVISVDGHDIPQIIKAFQHNASKPKMIIAKTIKGKGFKFSENNNDWHHKILTKNQHSEALAELENEK